MRAFPLDPSIEVFTYLGAFQQERSALHVWIHVQQTKIERPPKAIRRASADLYNLMIQEKMVDEGDNIMLFDIRDRVVLPTQTYHVESARMIFSPESFQTIWSRILSAERDSTYFVVSTKFNDEHEVIHHTYNQIEIPDMARRLQLLAVVHPFANFGPLEVYATNKKF